MRWRRWKVPAVWGRAMVVVKDIMSPSERVRMRLVLVVKYLSLPRSQVRRQVPVHLRMVSVERPHRIPLLLVAIVPSPLVRSPVLVTLHTLVSIRPPSFVVIGPALPVQFTLVVRPHPLRGPSIIAVRVHPLGRPTPLVFRVPPIATIRSHVLRWGSSVSVQSLRAPVVLIGPHTFWWLRWR